MFWCVNSYEKIMPINTEVYMKCKLMDYESDWNNNILLKCQLRGIMQQKSAIFSIYDTKITNKSGVLSKCYL